VAIFFVWTALTDSVVPSHIAVGLPASRDDPAFQPPHWGVPAGRQLAMDENKQPGLPSRIEQAGMRPPGIVGGREAFSQDSQPRRNPGRPKGSRNKMGHDLMTLVMQAAENVGFIENDPNTGQLVATGKGGVLKYLEWAAVNKADRFIALMARVAPKHVFADVTHDDGAMTKDEIEAELKDRGLPVDLLPLLLKISEDEVLDPDENPDQFRTMSSLAT
jgi:hypothetical protein